jgi:hypothetical protein
LLGSFEEVQSKTGVLLTDPHKPFVDALTYKCEKCGGTMTRVNDVIDCWYDSGSMPFARYHYPFENKDNLKEMPKSTKEVFIKQWHINFEGIHPFEDGNGRIGRILMNLQRLSVGLPILIIHEGEEQFEYYKWFKKNVTI